VSKIILDAALVERLRQSDETVELCDPEGNVVGLFTPKINPDDYEEVGPPISEEELQRRINSKERRYTTAEVLRYLKGL